MDVGDGSQFLFLGFNLFLGFGSGFPGIFGILGRDITATLAILWGVFVGTLDLWTWEKTLTNGVDP